MSRPGIYRYVLIERVEDYLRLGWCFAPGWYLGHWSVLMFWPCEECRAVEPVGGA